MHEHHLEVVGGALSYADQGVGRPVVFVQGVWVSRDLWADTVQLLAGRARTLQVDWPLGGHRTPFGAGADLSPEGIAELVLELIERLDLRDVVLVGNDTGGAVCQLAITAERPAAKRVSALVLTNTDSYENFPPKAFAPVRWLARLAPPIANILIARMASGVRGAERFMSSVCSKPVSSERATALLSNFAASRGSRADSLRFLAQADSRRTTLKAATRFRDFQHPVVLIWGDADQFFPISDGERLAAAFPNARLIAVPGAKTFVPLDAPEILANEIVRLT